MPEWQVRQMSFAKRNDPRDFTLCAAGGSSAVRIENRISVLLFQWLIYCAFASAILQHDKAY
jgi:hypothetical protein